MAWPGAVELGGEQLLGQRHADRVGDALPQRTGGGFDARASCRIRDGPAFSNAAGGSAGVPPSAGRSRSGAAAHRAASSRGRSTARSGRGRATAGWPDCAQVVVPQHFGDLGHAHRHAGVAGVGLLHGVHRQRADRVGQIGGGSPCGSPCGIEATCGSRDYLETADFWLCSARDPRAPPRAAYSSVRRASLMPSCLSLR